MFQRQVGNVDALCEPFPDAIAVQLLFFKFVLQRIQEVLLVRAFTIDFAARGCTSKAGAGLLKGKL